LVDEPIAAGEEVRQDVEHLRLHVEPIAGATKLVEARIELVVSEGVDDADGRWDGHVVHRRAEGRLAGASSSGSDSPKQ
jgi:hypothetical protein